MLRNAIAEEITGGLPRLMPGTVTGVELRSPPACLFNKKRKRGEKTSCCFPDTPPHGTSYGREKEPRIGVTTK